MLGLFIGDECRALRSRLGPQLPARKLLGGFNRRLPAGCGLNEFPESDAPDAAGTGTDSVANFGP
jgi:hypothetical protein